MMGTAILFSSNTDLLKICKNTGTAELWRVGLYGQS